jgi:hypothetical protein
LVNRWHVESPNNEVEGNPEARSGSSSVAHKCKGRSAADLQYTTLFYQRQANWRQANWQHHRCIKTLDDRKRKVFDDAANIFSELKTTNKLPRGGLTQIIERAKVENGLENEKIGQSQQTQSGLDIVTISNRAMVW